MHNKSNVKFLSLLLSLGLITSAWQTRTIYADSISNDNFQIDIQELDAPVEEQKATPTPSPKPQPQETLGLAYIPSTFSFSITEPLVDFGILSATNPVIRTTTLKISSPGSGYQVFAYANHVLLSKKNSTIPSPSIIW